MILRLLVSVLLLAAPTIGHASPPQVVGVRDVLFGANDTHILLIRTTGDNLGRYQPTQNDILLIARNRETNVDDQVWPIARTLDHGVDFADYGLDQRVETLPLGGRVDPFDILLETGARPMLGSTPMSAAELGVELGAGEASISLEEEDTVHRLTFADLSARIAASLNATRDRMPAHFIEGGEAGYDMLRDVEFDPTTDCDTGGLIMLFDQRGGEIGTTWLAEIRCANEHTMAPVTSLYVLPMVR